MTNFSKKFLMKVNFTFKRCCISIVFHFIYFTFKFLKEKQILAILFLPPFIFI